MQEPQKSPMPIIAMETPGLGEDEWRTEVYSATSDHSEDSESTCGCRRIFLMGRHSARIRFFS